MCCIGIKPMGWRLGDESLSLSAKKAAESPTVRDTIKRHMEGSPTYSIVSVGRQMAGKCSFEQKQCQHQIPHSRR
jgi:hypothetical protein